MGQRLETKMQAQHGQIRVVRLVDDYPIGGRSSYGLQPVYYNLSRVQALYGHDVHVIARRYAGEPVREENEGVQVHRVASPYTLNAMRAVRELANAHSPTIIHTHSTSGVFLAATNHLVRAPIVSHVHGTSQSAATPIAFTVGNMKLRYSRWRVTTSFMRERALWSRADRVAAVSTSVRSDLTSKYGVRDERIRLVYNGVDTSIFRPVDNPQFPEKRVIEGKKVVLYVGHFGLRKGIPFLISAMKTVTREVKDSVLVCIGGVPPWLPKSEYWAYLNQLIERNELKSKVILMDRVPNERLPDYYSISSVFVLPSYYEAFPKVLVEAMACGKPVVTTRLGGTEDSTEDGVNGFLVNYGDPADLANAIVKVLQDEQLAARMGCSGRERVSRDFTWEAVVSRINAIYEEVICQ